MPSSSTKTRVPGVYRRGNAFAYVISLGRDAETGQRQQKWVGGFSTIAEAKVARTPPWRTSTAPSTCRRAR